MLTTLHNWPSHPVLMVMMNYMVERKQVSQALKRNGHPRQVGQRGGAQTRIPAKRGKDPGVTVTIP